MVEVKEYYMMMSVIEASYLYAYYVTPIFITHKEFKEMTDCKNDMYWKGYNAYPTNNGYPTLDKHSTIEEASYLQGWHDARIGAVIFDDPEPTGICWLGDYTDAHSTNPSGI